jgi:hydroxyacylglutathione hydrolase
LSRLIQHTAVVGPLQCNCVLLACPDTLEAVLIDPGDEPQKILSLVQAQGVRVKYLLHTHAHFDHIGATAAVKEALGAAPCLHPADNEIYRNLPLQGRLFGFEMGEAPDVEKFLEDDEELSFGRFKLRVVHTPGHSPGGVCFQLVGEDERLFSGDTLFRQSIGRSDLWGGDSLQLVKSIKQRILTLRHDTAVFPGHGPQTEVGFEKKNNPFLV